MNSLILKVAHTVFSAGWPTKTLVRYRSVTRGRFIIVFKYVSGNIVLPILLAAPIQTIIATIIIVGAA